MPSGISVWLRGNGDLAPLTPASARNKAVAGKKIADAEKQAKEAK